MNSTRNAIKIPFISVLLVLYLGCVGCSRSDRRPIQNGRCLLIPLKLVTSVNGHGRSTAITLDAEGRLRNWSGKIIARFDPQGCVMGPDGPWVEMTSSGKLWTKRALVPLTGSDIDLGRHRLRIEPDGLVVFMDAQGRPDAGDTTSLRFEGYQPQALCCAQMLLMTHLTMMPSMAVSDGAAESIPPPEDSVCRGK